MLTGILAILLAHSLDLVEYFLAFVIHFDGGGLTEAEVWDAWTHYSTEV